MQQYKNKQFHPADMNKSFGESSNPTGIVYGFTGMTRPPMQMMSPSVAYNTNNMPQMLVPFNYSQSFGTPQQNRFVSNVTFQQPQQPESQALLQIPAPGPVGAFAKPQNSQLTLSFNPTGNNNFLHQTEVKNQQATGKSQATSSNKKPIETEVVEHKQFSNDTLNQTSEKARNFRIFTGTVERIIKWHRIYDSSNCYYEVIASVISIQEGHNVSQKIVLLRDKKGPVLQVIHYTSDHISIENFHIGQMLRCIGSMIGPNMLRAFTIRAATNEEIVSLQRLYYISDHAVSRAISNN